MSELYTDLMEGFQEIKESLQSGKELKTTIVSISEIKPDGPACRILSYLETGEMVKIP